MSLFQEFKRRKVFRVAVVYVATAFAVLQGADVILPNLGVPGWAMGFLVVLVLLGFPIALVLAWALEVTPDGVKRTGDAPNETQEATPSLLGTRTLVVAGLLVAVGVGLSAGWVLKPGAAGPGAEAESAGAVDVRASIAVLPFADLSPERDQEWFSDGLAEEILNLLASVRDLSVASRTSAFSFKGSPAPIPEIGERLGVQYVLEGSVRKADDLIRVTAQLIDVRTDRHLWSQNYDRTLADVFAVQDEIAASIGEALRVQLLGRDGAVVTATEISPELYEKFLESRFLIRQRSSAALARATALLEEVVEGEPGYAPGLAQLAEANLVSGGSVEADELERHLDRILELVDRALSVDSLLAGAFAVRGNVAMTRNEYVDALHDYQRAIALDPGDPRSHHWLAMLYSEAGHLDLGERAIAESLRLDPENANAEGYRAELLAARGRWAEAMASARRVTELGNPYGHVAGALFLLAVDPGALHQAESEMRLALAKGTHPYQVPLKAIAFASGDTAALASFGDDVRADRMWLYVATTALLALERPDALLTLLEWDDYHLFKRLSALVWSADQAALRRDPRFVQFLQRQGVTDLWREIGPPPDCRADGNTWRCGYAAD
jgi:TolB-like protein/Tfp pilus assembly protein PilF